MKHPRTRLLIAAVAALAVPAAAATVSADSWKLFVSKRYAYSIRYPSTWKARPATSNVTSGVPAVDDSSLDGFTFGHAKGTGLNVRIGAKRVPAGTTLASWSATDAKAIAAEYGCRGHRSQSMAVGGDAARLLTYRSCPPWANLYFLFVAVVHEDRGYQIYWLSPRGDEARDRALFVRFVKTFRFGR